MNDEWEPDYEAIWEERELAKMPEWMFDRYYDGTPHRGGGTWNE